MFKQSANDLWDSESKRGSIVTLCKDVDDALDHGIQTGVITEFIGAPGSGKTQMCLQLCVNVQIPRIIRGLEATAVYIDTDHGFSIDRLQEIASACATHCNQIIDAYRMCSQTSSRFDVNTITDNVLCTFCNSYVDVLAAVVNLAELLTKNPNIRLIVIDSFSHMLREVLSSLDRVRIVYQLLHDLRKLAERFQCAVVITNEVTTRIVNSRQNYISATLGDSARHMTHNRIIFGRHESEYGRFFVHIEKSAHKAESTTPFMISKEGIRSLPANSRH